jgi:hypothetical protein
MTLAGRAYFLLSRVLGSLLRSSRYSQVRIVHRDGEHLVRKQRVSYAPLLIWLGDSLLAILGAGVRVLPQREWENRERRLYKGLDDRAIRIDADGALVLPLLAGQTLSSILENPAVPESRRAQAIEHAVVALADFHRRGLTHGDAMAENVLVDLDAGIARWFDFETGHDSNRPLIWQRADDVRALLATCLLRTIPEKRAQTLRLILDAYANEEVTHVIATTFASVMRRSLPFHLGQAGLSCLEFQHVAMLMTERVRESWFDTPHRECGHSERR